MKRWTVGEVVAVVLWDLALILGWLLGMLTLFWLAGWYRPGS